jgi:hypothetical protein
MTTAALGTALFFAGLGAFAFFLTHRYRGR